MDIKTAVEIYKLVTEDSIVGEFGWVGGEFLVWVRHAHIEEFVARVIETTGGDIHNGGFECVLKAEHICVNLAWVYDGLEEIFPREKYQH